METVDFELCAKRVADSESQRASGGHQPNAAARRIHAGFRTASTTAPASRTPLVGVFRDATHVQVEVPLVAAGLVLVLLALRARAADTGSMHPVSA